MRRFQPITGIRLQRLLPIGFRTLSIVAVAGISFAMAAQEYLSNPDDPEYLRRQYAWFQKQDAGRQKQLRKLHADFQALDPDSNARYVRLMKQYNAWLARLPEADRERVVTASSALARIEIVRQLREQDWVNTLPAPYRAEYVKLTGDARKHRVQEWRNEEAERDEEWALASRSWDQFVPGKIPQLFLNDGRAQIEIYVHHLKDNLLDHERKALDDARGNAEDFGSYFGYALEIVRLSDAHPILPGRVGAKDFNSLPELVREYLVKTDKHFRKKGAVGAEELKDLRKSQGRWPEFALELTRYAQKNKLTLPIPLGDCSKDQMPAEVVLFLDKVLEPQLRRSDAGKADLELLTKAQGTWPDYPRMIMELAKKHKLPVPGWTLPGQPQMWDRFRSAKMRVK